MITPNPGPNPNACPFDYSLPVLNGDVGQQPNLARAWSDARARQLVHCAIAPGCTLTAADGTVLRAGTEVRLDHVSGSRSWLDFLVERRIIIEISPEEVLRRSPSPGRARYKIGPKKAVILKRIFSPGEFVGVEDCPEQQASPAVDAQPAQRDWAGNQISPALPALVARPAITGEEILLDLVRRGLVIDTHAERAKESA